jgi:hypothetical protein
MKRGDFVIVTAEGKTLEAMVVLASSNGRSLALMYDGILAGFVSMMPVLQNANGDWVAMNGIPVTITPQAAWQ